MKMVKIKKIINPILLGVMMSLCLVVVAQAEEAPVLESEDAVEATAQNPVIPTLENSIEQEPIEKTAVEETTTEVPERGLEPESVPQPQDDDYASIAKTVLIGASVIALLVLIVNKLYNKKAPKKGIKN